MAPLSRESFQICVENEIPQFSTAEEEEQELFSRAVQSVQSPDGVTIPEIEVQKFIGVALSDHGSYEDGQHKDLSKGYALKNFALRYLRVLCATDSERRKAA